MLHNYTIFKENESRSSKLRKISKKISIFSPTELFHKKSINDSQFILSDLINNNSSHFNVYFFKYLSNFLVSLKQMKSILSKSSGKRSEADIEYLIKILKNNDFFNSLNVLKDKSTLNQCFRYISLEIIKEGDYVFQYGQKADKFYIILKGAVSVLMPDRGLDITNLTAENKIENYIEIKILKIGETFGEYALLNNKPRTASILAKQDCCFAVLKKKDFKMILGAHEERKVIHKINDIQKSFYIFKNFQFNEMKDILTKMFEKHYTRHKKVFKCGEIANKIYFIKSGEFKLIYLLKNEKRNSKSTLPYINKFDEQDQFTEISIASFLSGSIVGEEDVYLSQKRSFDLICISEGSLWTINKEDLAEYWLWSDERQKIFSDLISNSEKKMKHYYERIEKIKKLKMEIPSFDNLEHFADKTIKTEESQMKLSLNPFDSYLTISELRETNKSINDKIYDFCQNIKKSNQFNSQIFDPRYISPVIRKIDSEKKTEDQMKKFYKIKKNYIKHSFIAINQNEKKMESLDEYFQKSFMKQNDYISYKLSPSNYEETKKKIKILKLKLGKKIPFQ